MTASTRSPSTQTTRVILVRHGRSTFNDMGRYQGSSNQSVLTEKGKATARLVGQYLAQHCQGSPIDVIYASPLQRVQQTAAEICKQISQPPPIEVSQDLKEISLSLWEGRTYADVREKFANDYHRWQRQPQDFELPIDGEQGVRKGELNAARNRVAVATETYFPVRDLYRDAQQFWTKTLPRHQGKTLLIVSHSGTIHALISTALGIGPSAHHSLQQSNCGISELTFTGHSVDRSVNRSVQTSQVQIRQINQTTVIGETLPKLKISKKGLRLLLLAGDRITPTNSKSITQRLATLPIDFYLSADDAKQSFHGHLPQLSKALWLSAQKSDFLEDWQHHLCQSRQPVEPLITGLAIAPARSIQKLIIQTLGQRAEECDRIAIRPGQLSIIHYPYTHRPVVQAINY